MYPATVVRRLTRPSITRLPLLIGLATLLISNAWAQQTSAGISKVELAALLQVKIATVETLGFHPKLVQAVKRQNSEQLSLGDIKERDRRWSESGPVDQFKVSLQENRAGLVLRTMVDQNSEFTEAFLTDDQGANVAAFPPTSDYWQGDEAKWTESYNSGNGVIFIGDIEVDDSTGLTQTQVSAPVVDPATSRTIGVLVVGVTFDYLQVKSDQLRGQ